MKYFLLAPLAIMASPERTEGTIAHMIEKINADPTISWKAGPNKKFELDSKPEDFAHLFGALEDPEHFKLAQKQIQVADNIPESFDPRDQWPQCDSLNMIRDQGSCGSCWAFGAASAFTDRACIQSDGAINYPLSVQDILSCCNTCGFGCNGGYLGPTWNWLVNHGTPSGGLYEGYGCKPYSIQPCEHHTEGDRPDCSDLPSENTPTCTSSCDNASYTTNPYQDDKVYGSTSYSVGNARNLDVIQTELMTNGPIEVSFTVYEDFMTYTGGVYYHTSGRSLGGHAIKLMGWGVDADTGMDYWLLVNSWNSDWGENGFFRMRRGTNECGLENSGVAGMINVDNLPSQ